MTAIERLEKRVATAKAAAAKLKDRASRKILKRAQRRVAKTKAYDIRSAERRAKKNAEA